MLIIYNSACDFIVNALSICIHESRNDLSSEFWKSNFKSSFEISENSLQRLGNCWSFRVEKSILEQFLQRTHFPLCIIYTYRYDPWEMSWRVNSENPISNPVLKFQKIPKRGSVIADHSIIIYNSACDFIVNALSIAPFAFTNQGTIWAVNSESQISNWVLKFQKISKRGFGDCWSSQNWFYNHPRKFLQRIHFLLINFGRTMIWTVISETQISNSVLKFQRIPCRGSVIADLIVFTANSLSIDQFSTIQ